MTKSLPFIAAAFLVSGLWYVQAQERGQTQLQGLGQKKHEAEISQRPHESGLLEPEFEEMKKSAQKTPLPTAPTSPPTLKDKLSQGWRFYKRGDYAKAVPLFIQASAAPDAATANEARLGLAYANLKQGRKDRAKEIFEELVAKKYKTGEVLASLLPLLLADQEYSRAEPYLALLPEKERMTWEKKFQEARVRDDYRKLTRPPSPEDLNQFVAAHREGLEGCAAQDVFARAAKDLAAAGARTEAASLYRDLLKCPETDWKARLGVVYGLSEVSPPGEMESLLAEEKKKGPKEYRGEVSALELSLLRRQLAAVPPGSAEAERASRKILALQPGDRSAQRALAWTCFNQGKYEEAYRLFSSLHSRYPGERDYALGLAYTQMKMGRDGEALALAEKAPFQDLEWQRIRAQLYLKKGREAFEKKDYPRAEAYLNKALGIEPENRDARILLGWTLFSRGQDDRALSLFSSLHREYPSDRDIALGLIYTQIRMGKTDEALALADGVVFQDREWQEIRAQLYLKKGGEAYAKKKFGEAQTFAGKALAIQPENQDARLLLARSYSAQGKPREALPIFLDLYQKSPSPEMGQSVLSTYDQMGERKKAYPFAESMGKEASPASRRAAAEYYASHDAPVRAAQTDPEKGTCYFNAGKPSLEASLLFRYKSGSEGFDKLTEADFPITLDYPARYGKKWSFSLIPAYLSSGSAPSFPYAGSYYRFANGGTKQNDLVTSLWAVKPEIGFQKEGPIRYGFLLGTSFLGGPVSPLPTFTAGLSGKNWLVDIHQLQVDESILSYAGQKDPYADKEWGRVLRSGIEGEITFEPRPAYWLSFAAGYDYLWGQDVWSNQSIFGTASFGKTIPMGPGDLSAGLFATAKHFQRNTDFFTFSHGGYFSPEIFFMTGPTLRYWTTPCAGQSIDARVSAGYMYYRTKDSPHYPLFDENLSALNGPAQADATGNYSGENVSRLGLSGKVRGVKLFGSHWLGSAYLGFNNASSYNEWRTGVSLQYFFDSITNAGEFRHFLLREPEDRFQRFTR
jgi:tetratricopeptide (TPR) repeat protein